MKMKALLSHVTEVKNIIRNVHALKNILAQIPKPLQESKLLETSAK
jgi:hypothetical protein